ncbi:MAG: Hint domain-containing protein, partial [Acetobacteraceae bacterium]|nr:Hint domain-containing protein [Acetobacteraceae bacterium]
FAEGTRILTNRGEVAVEALAEGDMVVTADQGTRPINWIGHRHLDLTAHPRPEFAAPVRISRGAFAENQPQRDLVVSPDHCLFVDGKLVPAKLLINGMTIVQDRDAKAVTYYHVELDRHAVLFAEGLPAESYLDTGNRAFFSNAGLALMLHPEFHVNAGLNCWEQDACAPLAVSDSAVHPVWQDLASRAEALGFTQPEILTTDDADLRLVAAGRTFRPISAHANRFVFVLPAGVTGAQLVSRAGSPADVKPWLDDRRQLGVAVSRIVVRGGTDFADVAIDHPTLRQGWHTVETEGRAMWRWTSGNAVLPIEVRNGPVTVEVHVRQTGTYVVAAAQRAERLAA